MPQYLKWPYLGLRKRVRIKGGIDGVLMTLFELDQFITKKEYGKIVIPRI